MSQSRPTQVLGLGYSHGDTCGDDHDDHARGGQLRAVQNGGRPHAPSWPKPRSGLAWANGRSSDSWA